MLLQSLEESKMSSTTKGGRNALLQKSDQHDLMKSLQSYSGTLNRHNSNRGSIVPIYGDFNNNVVIIEEHQVHANTTLKPKQELALDKLTKEIGDKGTQITERQDN